MEEKDIIEALKKGGFPFEVLVRRELKQRGIDAVSSQYMSKSVDSEISKEIDAVSIVINKGFEANSVNIHTNLVTRLIGEAKSLENYAICFYELDNENPKNFLVPFPNFMNKCYAIPTFRGGSINLYEIGEKFTTFPPISKSACLVKKNEISQKNPNQPVYSEVGNNKIHEFSNDLARACEYFHKKSDFKPANMLTIHACFPVVFTKARLFRVSGYEDMKLDEVDMFLYFAGVSDPTSLKFTMKERFHFPVLICNQKGIERCVAFIQRINEVLIDEIKELSERYPSQIKREYEDM